MLFSKIASRNNVKVVRFAHGGERIFFKDSYYDYELINVDEYVSYSLFTKIIYQK